MARYVQDGKIINFYNNSDSLIRFGDVLTLTGRIGVAAVDIADKTIGAVELEGVFEVNAETTAAFTVGQTVYWDAPNNRVTATKAETGAILAGIAIEPKAASAASALIKL
jgi:predicted RecA/RadA family phage recombinase